MRMLNIVSARSKSIPQFLRIINILCHSTYNENIAHSSKFALSLPYGVSSNLPRVALLQIVTLHQRYVENNGFILSSATE
jgi:hypothetical protein